MSIEITHIWNLKSDTNELKIYKTETDSQTDTNGYQRGKVWEGGVD